MNPNQMGSSYLWQNNYECSLLIIFKNIVKTCMKFSADLGTLPDGVII